MGNISDLPFNVQKGLFFPSQCSGAIVHIIRDRTFYPMETQVYCRFLLRQTEVSGLGQNRTCHQDFTK